MTEFETSYPGMNCPIPSTADAERITLAYGEGGRLTRKFVRERILSRFGNDHLQLLGDSALLESKNGRIAFTTDSYTVTPLFFPGGDIGNLCIYGTVNDLAVSGATPCWISLSLIIEEGLSWSVLDKVLDSIRSAAEETNVVIATGDTKVVPRGAVDKLFITTSGIGEITGGIPQGPTSLKPGDVLIVSGPIGRHGTAILCAREQFDFNPPPASDCASVAEPISALLSANLISKSIRDATRGGVAAVLFEWSEACGLTCVVDEKQLPISADVNAVCELLGLDPLHIANEGTFVIGTSPELVEPTLRLLKQFEVSRQATVIGRVSERRSVPVITIRTSGREIPLDEPSGTPLPRIC